MPTGKLPEALDSPTAELAPQQLAQSIETYLAEHPDAAVLEDGRALFDMRTARYSVTQSHGRCLLQFWSEERNLMRSVVGLQARAQCLRLMTRKMGSPKPQVLELAPTSDRRTPSARETARHSYQRLLERVLTRRFLGAKVDAMRSATDLEHSFGPAYARGWLLKGTAAEAVIGVGQGESGAAIDGILTLGILWLDYCRRHGEARRHVSGLKVIVPAGAWRTTAERMVWLNHRSADFQLYTLDERTEELEQVDCNDTGNLQSRLVHSFSPQAASARCRAGLDRILTLLSPSARERIEIHPNSATDVGVLLHGLEFARVRHGPSANSFLQEDTVTFGAGAHETPLNEETRALFRDLFSRLFQSRCAEGVRTDPLFRLQPERWLEARLRKGIEDVLPAIRADHIYSQVPALCAGERGMLDLLTLDRHSRLTVIELKADEDLQLPVQALDYWIRVRALNLDRQTMPGSQRALSAFERQGYFAGTEVSPLPPRLLLAAPALHLHPANEPVLRHFSPEIEWELIALSEHWRRELKIVFRKTSQDASRAPRNPS